MERETPAISVYRYADYRVYLRDALDEKLRVQPRLSLRALASRAGFSSPGYLQMVMSGERSLTPQSALKVASLLSLRASDEEFFLLLVGFNQAKSIAKKKQLIGRMYALTRSGEATAPVRILGLDFAWYNFVILEMATCRGFRLNPETAYWALGQRVSRKDVREALCFLETQGFVQSIGDENYALLNAQQVRTPDEVRSLNVQDIHRQACANAADSLSLPLADREFQSITLALSKARFQELKTELKSITDELVGSYADDAQAEEVYQINLQAFPVTQIGTVLSFIEEEREHEQAHA